MMDSNTTQGALYAPDNKTQLIVIKGNGNSGKTTTCWMILFDLLSKGAVIDTINKNSFVGQLITNIPPLPQKYDFYAELKWNDKQIVIYSLGDKPEPVDAMLQHALPMKPDFIICPCRSQRRSGSTWELFQTTYTNILYRRICVWPEHSSHPDDKYAVKQPMIEMIVKSMM